MLGKGAIIMVLGFLFVNGILGLRLTRLQSRAMGNMTYYHDVTSSHNLAVAGANTSLSLLTQNPLLRGNITSQSYTSGTFSGGSFSARLDSLSPTQLRLRSTSQYRNYRDTVEVYLDPRMQRSFAMFAWMTNNEDGVYWITGDTVWGRVHSNGTINVSGRPVFWERVTTARSFSPSPGTGTNNAIFKNGYETGVAPIVFPNDLSYVRNDAISGGKRYTTDIWLTISPGSSSNNDGKVYVRTSASGSIIDSVSLSSFTFNGVIWSDRTIYVKGTLDGRLTIGAGRDMVITDDVKYAVSPLVDIHTDDMLGLVAEDDIIIADNSANNNGVEVHASIFSRNGSFTAEDYDDRVVSTGPLRLVGGIIQDDRGAVGTFSGSRLASGFSKRYHFDQRFADPQVRPPSFPGFWTQTLTITSWWENVRIPL